MSEETRGKHVRLTDTDRTTPNDDNVLGIGKLAAPGMDMGQYFTFVQRKVGGPFPLGPWGKDEDFVWDGFAALQHDLPSRLGVLGLDGRDDADPGLALAFLVESIQRDECGLLELGSLADHETEGCGEGNGVGTGADEDELVLGRVELGGEGGGDGYPGVASTDDDDVLLGRHVAAQDSDMAALYTRRVRSRLTDGR